MGVDWRESGRCTRELEVRRRREKVQKERIMIVDWGELEIEKEGGMGRKGGKLVGGEERG